MNPPADAGAGAPPPAGSDARSSAGGGAPPAGAPAAPDNPPPAPSLEGAPPPAAELVLESDAAEGEAAELVRLRRQLEDERTGRKRDQQRLAELEDENRRLKTPPAPKPAAQKRSFLDGATFFD